MWNTEETWKTAKNPDKALNIILRPHRLSMKDRLKMIFTMGRAQCMTKTERLSIPVLGKMEIMLNSLSAIDTECRT